jgi:hypothetical protein
MDTVAKISAETTPAINLFVNAVAVMCGLALVVCVCAATNGLDISSGLF